MYQKNVSKTWGRLWALSILPIPRGFQLRAAKYATVHLLTTCTVVTFLLLSWLGSNGPTGISFTMMDPGVPTGQARVKVEKESTQKLDAISSAKHVPTGIGTPTTGRGAANVTIPIRSANESKGRLWSLSCRNPKLRPCVACKHILTSNLLGIVNLGSCLP